VRGLDVTVELPPGWEAAVTPELSRVGDRLSGSLAAGSADALALTLRAPVSGYYRKVWAGTVGLFLSTLSVSTVLLWRLGLAVRRWQSSGDRGMLKGYFLAFSVAGLVLAPGLLFLFGTVWWQEWLPSLSDQTSPHYRRSEIGWIYVVSLMGMWLVTVVVPLGAYLLGEQRGGPAVRRPSPG
jgi:hypothetical protein